MRPIARVLVLVATAHFVLRLTEAIAKDYSVFYNIKLIETLQRVKCLQCFNFPCRKDEQRLRPLDAFAACCRSCRVRGAVLAL